MWAHEISIMHFCPQQLRGWVMPLVGAFPGHLHTGLECHGMVITGNWLLFDDVGWVSQTRRCFLGALAHRAGVHAPHHLSRAASWMAYGGQVTGHIASTASLGKGWSACTSSLSVLHKYRAALGMHAECWAGMSTVHRPADVLPDASRVAEPAPLPLPPGVQDG